MRFKTNENLHPEIAELLRRHGHDAVTVWDQGLQGNDDGVIIDQCRLEKRALVTLDSGFADIRNYPPAAYFGLIVLRLNDQSRAHVLTVLPKVLELMETEPLEMRLWVVDENKVRIRGEEPGTNLPNPPP